MIHGSEYVEYFKKLTKTDILKDEFIRRMKTGDLFNVKSEFPLDGAVDRVLIWLMEYLLTLKFAEKPDYKIIHNCLSYAARIYEDHNPLLTTSIHKNSK